MHEMSVALEVCRMAEERLAPATSAAAGRASGVEVGDDAGVEPESLSFCLEALLAEPPFRRRTPVIRARAGDVLRVDYLEVDDGRPDD